MKLIPGLIINNRYHLLRIIATGGMGEMWLANDNVLSREVAIKALREENAGNENFLQRLRIEARNNAILTHPNIVSLHDYTEESGIGFIVMEYIEGRSLADLLRSQPTLELTEILPILIQVARALGFAHKQGIIHRDIKPANILLDMNNNVKVVDFGVSKAMNQINMTATGMVVGTAQYLSPEQAIGDSATGASDLYALGVIAYEASQGRRPFTGKNAVDIAIAQVNNPVPPMNDDTNPDFQKLLLNLLEKNVLKRAVDGSKVADDFEKLLNQLVNESNNVEKTSATTPTPKITDTPSTPEHYQFVQTTNSPAKRNSHRKALGGRHADERNFLGAERTKKSTPRNVSVSLVRPKLTVQNQHLKQQVATPTSHSQTTQPATSVRTTTQRNQAAKLRKYPKRRKKLHTDKVALLLVGLIVVIVILIAFVTINISNS